jgi:hypothetical protein
VVCQNCWVPAEKHQLANDSISEYPSYSFHHSSFILALSEGIIIAMVMKVTTETMVTNVNMGSIVKEANTVVKVTKIIMETMVMKTTMEA